MMSSPVRIDGANSEFSQYVPKRYREQPDREPVDREPVATPRLERPPYVRSASTVPLPSPEADRVRRTRSEHLPWPEPVPEPFIEPEGVLAVIGRVGLVAGFAAVVALAVVFGKPLFDPMLDAVHQLLGSDSQSQQVSKSTDQVAATEAVANRALVSTTAVASVPAGTPAVSPQVHQARPTQQQASLTPSANLLGSSNSPVRGVTDSEIRFGISAPLSGPAKELGQNMKLGIEAAFNVANANGGVYGRQLRLIAVDDGYEPARTAVTMKQLYEKEQVFGVIGNVGTPTAVVALPYALDRKMLFFGAFTGAGLLRSDPPDRYVFNYRASYAEETAAVVNYLVKVRHLSPEQIAVFAQQDAYGDAGFAGVERAIRSLRGENDSTILRLNYQRNTVDVDDAVAQLLQKRRIPIKAVIMVPTYRAAARFIEKTRDHYPDMIYTSVSFVGSTALANELMLLGNRYAAGVIVTQVVPAVDGHSSLVLDYKSTLAKYFPGQEPDYVSLEGYVDANVLIAALQRNGAQLDTEKLVGTMENLRDLDIGLGTPVTFNRSEHQGVHKVWGTQLDATGHYQPIDLQ
jgi:branched-chain amino acid transport system substrate-binding protein